MDNGNNITIRVKSHNPLMDIGLDESIDVNRKQKESVIWKDVKKSTHAIIFQPFQIQFQ